MKKSTLLLGLFLFISPLQAQTGWMWQNPLPQGNPLYSIDLCRYYGWAVGPNGTALHTIDGGITWKQVDLGTGENFNSVYMHDDLMAFMVGDNGLIQLVIEDVATNTFEIRKYGSNTIKDLNSVTSNINGCPWVVGDAGTILRSNDFWFTWEDQSIPNYEPDLYDHDNIECTEAFAVGKDGLVLYTYDLGNTWSYRNIPTTLDMLAIDIGTFENIRAVGQQNNIWHTSDKGLSWKKEYEEIGYNLNDILNSGTNTAYAVGLEGKILETIDFGETWKERNTGTNSILYSITDPWSLDYKLVSGHYGIILKNDGIQTDFEMINKGPLNFLQSIEFVNNETGWAVGGATGWGGTSDGIILHTTNGGETWEVQQDLQTPLNAMDFVNENKGWAVGRDGLIKFTSNGGANWGTQTSPLTKTLTSVCFTDENNGWIVSMSNWGEIIHTTNGGTTWTLQTNPSGNPLHDVFFIDGNKGWAVGLDSSVIRTTDGGAHWEWINVNASLGYRFASVFFVDEMHGWITGIYGSIMRTTNGGETWQEVESGIDETLNDIYFIDKEIGWVVGDAGTVLHSIDGGASWSEQVSGVATNFLTSICFVDGQKGWVAGEGGTIINTLHGGSNMVNTIYVDDDNNTGTEDGSILYPFNTVAEAIEAAIAGDSVFIFNGEYLETPLSMLDLKDGLIIVGEDSANTVIAIPFYTGELTMKYYTEISGLTCPGYSAANDDGTATLRIKDCHIGSVNFSSENGYTFIVEDCTIDGSVNNASGKCILTIRNNHFLNGGINDSGQAPEGIEAHIIEGNTIDWHELPPGQNTKKHASLSSALRNTAIEPPNAAIEANSTSISIKNNTINIQGEGSGIIVSGGSPANIIGNTINLPLVNTPTQTAGIKSSADSGIVKDNVITGGYYGYYSSSTATVFENNKITKAHTGFYGKGAEKVQNNIIKDCSGNGLIANGLSGPLQDNTIIENDSAGIVVLQLVDLGGGEKNSEGRNVLQNNGYYDLHIKYQPDEQDTLFARYNLWDHVGLDEILSNDVRNEGNEKLVLDIGGFIIFPNIPELFSPVNNASNDTLNIELSWWQTAIPDRYHVQVAMDNNFASMLIDTTNLNDTILLIALEQETVYYWRVQALNPAGKSDWSEVWQFTTDIAGLVANEKDLVPVDIYPNPSSGILTINSEILLQKQVIITIIDLNGKKLKEKNIPAGTNNIILDISELENGIYLCHIRTQENSLVRRIIIQK